ncbi:hypothetical protein I302_108083 [Kwoniella bestiolae CBS 10118]|uniref:Uncharacterized protein n=1 Tax=Kwoniella bestiolae CBS 10118 TaxID=1296100 RepID=A0A1B9FWQ0_9TREE|nr:hypothetical protein I302_07551 [Kwoniella bestiolae CBS 10118]OCF23197.1 hypothetical protein I302_07551 [Kwoniella bestiolae CBS 10118]
MIEALEGVSPAFSGLSERALQGMKSFHPTSTSADLDGPKHEESTVTILHVGEGEPSAPSYTPRTVLWFKPSGDHGGFDSDAVTLLTGDRRWTGTAFYLLNDLTEAFKPLPAAETLGSSAVNKFTNCAQKISSPKREKSQEPKRFVIP